MFDEDHPPVDARAKDWEDHILGHPKDYSPEEAANEEARELRITQKIIDDFGIINA